MAKHIGVDIGGSNLRAALIDSSGEILKLEKLKTEPLMGKERVLHNIKSVIKKVIDKDVVAIGIGCPGPLDFEKGMTLNTPNIPKNMEIVGPLHKEFSVDVKIDNDANCFGLAEYNFGNKVNNLLCLTLGTGLGASFLINGKLYRGRGNALELGHNTIKFDDLKGKDNIAGSVEYFVSTLSQKRYAEEEGLGVIKSAGLIHEMAVGGNLKARKVFERFGFYLGIALANFINTFDPDLVVIGGACAGSWDLFYDSMIKEVNLRCIVKPCEIKKSNLENAGVLGAGCLVNS